jgi:hypothetical protein
MPDAEALSWAQAAGVVAFGSAVLYQLRQVTPALVKLGDALGEVKEAIGEIREVVAAMLERERIRGERRRDPSVQNMRQPTWSDGSSTDLIDLVEMQRHPKPKRKTPPMGIRQPRSGSHHDEVE